MLQSQVVGHVFGQMRWRRLSIFPESGFRCCMSPAAMLAANIAALFVIPGGLVVGLRRSIKTRIKSILGQLETVLDYKCCVCVVEQVVFGDAIVFDGVMNQAAEESDVGACANLAEQ